MKSTTEPKMSFHRFVLRRAEKAGRFWEDRDRPCNDISCDVGYFPQYQTITEQLHSIQKMFSGCRVVRHFAISENEMNNGSTCKSAK